MLMLINADQMLYHNFQKPTIEKYLREVSLNEMSRLIKGTTG